MSLSSARFNFSKAGGDAGFLLPPAPTAKAPRSRIERSWTADKWIAANVEAQHTLDRAGNAIFSLSPISSGASPSIPSHSGPA